MAPSNEWLPSPVTLLTPFCVRRLQGAANGPFKAHDSWNMGQRWLKQLGEHKKGQRGEEGRQRGHGMSSCNFEPLFLHIVTAYCLNDYRRNSGWCFTHCFSKDLIKAVFCSINLFQNLVLSEETKALFWFRARDFFFFFTENCISGFNLQKFTTGHWPAMIQ